MQKNIYENKQKINLYLATVKNKFIYQKQMQHLLILQNISFKKYIFYGQISLSISYYDCYFKYKQGQSNSLHSTPFRQQI